jgi:hypothetical protein
VDEEQNNRRYATYSLWHRERSIVRYLENPDDAHQLGCIDIDAVCWIEWERGSRDPLALIETARDDPGKDKSGTVLRNLGALANIPTFIVLYVPASHPNPAYPQVPDIERFRIRRLWPDPEKAYRELTCKQYAEWLKQLRELQTRNLLRKRKISFWEG